jgi:hypothetical protein
MASCAFTRSSKVSGVRAMAVREKVKAKKSRIPVRKVWRYIISPSSLPSDGSVEVAREQGIVIVGLPGQGDKERSEKAGSRI